MNSVTNEQPVELQPKEIREKVRTSLGWNAILECGHEVFFMVEPMPRVFCGVCVDGWVERNRKTGQVGG